MTRRPTQAGLSGLLLLLGVAAATCGGTVSALSRHGAATAAWGGVVGALLLALLRRQLQPAAAPGRPVRLEDGRRLLLVRSVENAGPGFLAVPQPTQGDLLLYGRQLRCASLQCLRNPAGQLRRYLLLETDQWVLVFPAASPAWAGAVAFLEGEEPLAVSRLEQALGSRQPGITPLWPLPDGPVPPPA